MRKVLCVDYNFYLLPENADVTGILNALQHPVDRQYECRGEVFRDKNVMSCVSVSLVDDSVINQAIPATQEPEL